MLMCSCCLDMSDSKLLICCKCSDISDLCVRVAFFGGNLFVFLFQKIHIFFTEIFLLSHIRDDKINRGKLGFFIGV